LFIFLILNAENQITSFIGGDYTVSTRIIFPSIYCSKRITPNRNLYNSAASFIENPAGLAYIKKTIYSSKIVPTVLIDPDLLFKVYDSNGIDGISTRVVDKILDNLASADLQPTYPTTNVLGGQAGGLQQLTVTIPNSYGTAGVNFQRDFLLDFEMNGNGANGILEDITEDEVTKVVLDVETAASLDLAMNSINIGFGRMITDELSVGVGSSIIYTNFKGSFDVLFEGMLRQYGGNADVSFAFNDPVDADNFRNTLNSSIDFDLEAHSLKVFAGANYLYNDFFFSTSIKSPSKNDLNGDFKIIQHALGAVNPEAFTPGSDLDRSQIRAVPSRLPLTS